jgi:2'-5' RNA ligase
VESRCPDRSIHLDSTQDFRLFIAMTIPDAVKGAIQKAQEELRRVIPEKAVRWTRREQFHLTLQFLGNVPACRVAELIGTIRPLCEAFSPLRLRAARIGFFPNARFPRVVWVGMNDLKNRLAVLWTAVQSATQPFTKEAPELEFTGHVTLARVNRLRRDHADDLARSAGRFENTIFGEWTADQIELMRSELLPEGARHNLLAALPLLGRQALINGENSI